MGIGCSQKKAELYSFIQCIWLPSQSGSSGYLKVLKCQIQNAKANICTSNQDKSINHKPTTSPRV